VRCYENKIKMSVLDPTLKNEIYFLAVTSQP
jgi:hypothetical protein